MTLNSRFTRPSAALTATLVLAVAVGTGCGSSSSASDSGGKGATVRIARTGYFDPLALAQGDGSLSKAVAAAGGRATYTAPFGAFAPVAQALNSGAVDIGVGSITSAIGGLAGQSGYTIFAAQQPNTVDEGIVVPKSSSIRSIADLKGKSVAVNKAGTGEYLLRKALATENIPSSAVKINYLPPPQAAPAFASGKLEAWATWGNFSDTARAVNGGRFVAKGGEIGSQNDIILVVRNAFLKAHPELVRAVYDAGQAESVKSRQNPAAATELGNRTAKLSAPVAKLQTEAYRTQPALEPVGSEVLRSFQEVADFFHKEKVIPAEPAMKDHVVDVRTLKKAER